MKRNFKRIQASDCNGMTRLKNDFYHAEFGLFQKILEKNNHCAEKHIFLLISVFWNVKRKDVKKMMNKPA